jgi:methylamine utilization protein MauE
VNVDPALQGVLRGGLVLLFASAAFHKLRAPREFAATLADYRLLPGALAPAAAAALAGAEVVLAAALAAQRFEPEAPLAAAGLLALYSLAIAANLARGRREIDCGCLGPAGRQPLSGWLLARNGLLVAACLALAAPRAARSLHSVDGVTVAGGVAVLALLWSAAHRLGAPPAGALGLGRSS